MERRREPRRRRGHKNIYCPFYDVCLDYAAKRHWHYWDCSECSHKLEQSPITLGRSTRGFGPYCELPVHISGVCQGSFDFA